MENPISFHFNLAVDYINRGALGAASNLFYRTIMLDPNHYQSWVSLIFGLGIMKETGDQQILLARYAKRELPYVKELIGSALSAYKHNPKALMEWLRLYSERAEEKDREMLGHIIADIGQMMAKNAERIHAGNNPDKESSEPPSLDEIAEHKIYLDWIPEKKPEEIYDLIEPLLDLPQSVDMAIRMLTYFPGLRAEKMLRRICRSEETSNKSKTRALIALHWHGATGNAKLIKFGDSFVVNLQKPEPKLGHHLPDAYSALVDWVLLWWGKANGVIEGDQQLETSPSGKLELGKEQRQVIESQINPNIPAAAESIMRETYLHYYPRIAPIVNEIDEWGAALLNILSAFSQNWEEPWKFPLPELQGGSGLKREWLLKALLLKDASEPSGEPEEDSEEDEDLEEGSTEDSTEGSTDSK
ncbi:hypothetical protein [Paenibacillus sp. J2TS4]|uniref:hypothetical protein n=1 Tax=Paenibacillus sp. J2TS4 TaxID=2807194 RepID=UPI001B2F084B|nr:hypothetical protein [Paenibacillus sp. J2TS4]GIP34118.1 hypothetical protein J2TS4_33280 [Paenibacillus sp. J2TS4]